MNKGYRTLTEGIKNRNNPENFIPQRSFREELSSIEYSDVLVYIRYAMKGVEPAYTQVSKQAGENVKSHLKPLEDVEFQFQGSVMTNTHIKAYSDIDLLVISSKFYTWDKSESEKYINENDFRSRLDTNSINKLIYEQNNFSLYQGDFIADLKKLRSDSEYILKSKYVICNINEPKCIKIKNQDLNRSVDVVVANWYDDIRSVIYDKGVNRGIQIFNKSTNDREDPDYPFVSIKRINERGNLTNGRIKKMIRFLKNIKSDSSLEINLNSFDINAICYDIEPAKYQNASFLELVPIVISQLNSICTNPSHAERIVSVDEREYIFKYRQSKLKEVQKVLSEIQSIYLDLKKVIQNV
ncbi:nucleotidyltransferase-like protein [Larkinella arboricola]|uniref:Nucleotidyltransferase-like protein n=1 Tax=Larkinella arboricola TaxID=643671 RepID=A0A327WLH6_LARAB|nr:nucleotidyltransferase domain-containing protein [Larkinella arboricola]RAJ92231.1 nucleotidyltransferase-like protein [Larkinella arboricola]